MVAAQDHVKLAKVAKKPSTYNVTDKKPAPPKQKIFFRVQTTRLFASFDALTRSVTGTGAEIFPCKATCESAVFLQIAWINPDVVLILMIWTMSLWKTHTLE